MLAWVMNLGFAASPAGVVSAPVVTPQTNAGSRKRHRRYSVAIAGREFDVGSIAEVWQLLTEAKRLARQHALELSQQAANRQVGRSRPKPPVIEIPTISTPVAELKAAVVEVEREVRQIYESALRDAEISMWIEVAKRRDETEDSLLLLM